MASSKYQVGDKLRIRQWDDMVEEFGVKFDKIPCVFGFYATMKYLCGAQFTVKSISKLNGNDSYSSVERVESGEYSPSPDCRMWHISEDMLEPIEPPIEIASSEFFDEMLI